MPMREGLVCPIYSDMFFYDVQKKYKKSGEHLKILPNRFLEKKFDIISNNRGKILYKMVTFYFFAYNSNYVLSKTIWKKVVYFQDNFIMGPHQWTSKPAYKTFFYNQTLSKYL